MSFLPFIFHFGVIKPKEWVKSGDLLLPGMGAPESCHITRDESGLEMRSESCYDDRAARDFSIAWPDAPFAFNHSLNDIQNEWQY